MVPPLLRDEVVNSQSRKRKPSTSTTNESFPGYSSVKQPRLEIPVINPPPSGIFAGSSGVDARHGNFTDASVTFAGNLQINVESQVNGNFLDKLPRAKRAGWRSGNHVTCLEGTRTGELQRIQEWQIDDTMAVIFWLCGIAGSGKSTIAQTFAEHCHAQGRLGASFFCSRDFPGRRNIRLIFPTLAYYLAIHSPEFRAALIPILRNSPDISEDSLEVQFEELLIQPLQSLQSANIHTTIIIDALDECEDKESTSAILSVIARRIHVVPFVKFFITGRPEPRIESGFRLPLLRPQSEVFLLHEVDRISVDQDIELYLTTNLLQIAAHRGYGDSTKPWPSKDEIIAATVKCAGLFIVASVIIKFVASLRHNPRERLRIISNPDSTIHEGKFVLDGTYDLVFIYSFHDVGSDDVDFLDLFQIVVGSIVLALDPLSCESLAMILGISREDVRTALISLHSVFVVPESSSEEIRICHKSLADYLTDATRCTDPRFYINPSAHHLELGIRCLHLMDRSLKRNICDIPRYAMNADVEDLATRREKYIGRGLEYACRSWARHLQLGSRNGVNVVDVVELLQDFFRCHLLQWLEVLSIVGDMRCAVYSLRDVKSWLSDVLSPDADLLGIIKDSERFVLMFFDAIESSAAHIYDSALRLCPSMSQIRALYQDEIPRDVKVNGFDASWDGSIRAIQLQQVASCVSFSPKGSLIAVGGWNSYMEIFETATGQHRAKMRTDSVVDSLAFSPDDAILVTGGRHGGVDFWDLQTGGHVETLEGHTGPITSVIFSPDGSMIATSSEDGTIRIWGASFHDCKCVFEGRTCKVRIVCWSFTGNEVISGSDDGIVKVWSISDQECSKTFNVHSRPVYSVACSPDASLIASGSGDGKVNILNAATGTVLHTIPTNYIIDLVRFLDRDKIMYTSSGSTFVIRDLTERVDMLEVKYEGEAGAISSDGTRFVSSDADVVKIWETDNKYHQDMAGHHIDTGDKFIFSRDGGLVASVSQFFLDDVMIWNTSTGQLLGTIRCSLRGLHRVWFSPDSRLFASVGTYDTIQIWDVQTGKQVSTLDEGGPVFDACFTPNGNQLATIAWDTPGNFQRVDLWEVATRQCLASRKVDSEFSDISFDTDGTSVILRGDGQKTQRLRLSSTPTYFYEAPSFKFSSPPMSFVPALITEPILPDISPVHHYCHEQGSPWILDRQDRRRLWVPPDFRGISGSCREAVVFGSRSGFVSFVKFLV